MNEYFSFKREEYGELGQTCNAMGDAYLSLNNLKKAKEMFKKALGYGLKYFGKEAPIVMRAYGGLGSVYLLEKKTAKGLHYLLKQLHLCANYKIESQQITLRFHDFQQVFSQALQNPRIVSSLQIVAQEAACLSEKVLGKDDNLTTYFLQISSMIDNSQLKI